MCVSFFLLKIYNFAASLETTNVKSPDEIIKERFADVGRVPQAFSSIKYLGTRTESPPTDFTELKQTVKECLANSSVRSSRSPAVIYKALMVTFSINLFNAEANYVWLICMVVHTLTFFMHNCSSVYNLFYMLSVSQCILVSKDTSV